MGTPLVNAHEWPSGLTLTWSSLFGRWTYNVLDQHGLENTLVLPVPSLAAPSAVSSALPALMDGRHGLLPASEERWEHAGLLESWAESAAQYGDDKYDAAYQAAEEEAEALLRWQEQFDGAETAGPDPVKVPADQEKPVSLPAVQEARASGESVLLDPDGAPLPPVEEASLDLLVRMLAMCADLADEMNREPHSFTVHADVLLAQYSRVANVGQWVGLAATALRRDLLEHLGRVPSTGEAPTSGEAGGLTRYRVVAQLTDDAHPGAATLTHFTYARSAEEAAAKVRTAHERPGGVYGDQGLYQVVEITDEGPSSEARQQEAARRCFVTTVMDAALAETSQGTTHLPHPEMFGILCDFFTRAIVFPGQFGFPSGTAADDTQLHTSDPARALSRLLLEHLTHHALDLVEADDRAPAGLMEMEAEGRPLAPRDDEDNEAPAELVDRVLAVCEQHYAAVTGTNSEQWDRESARELVDTALRTVRMAERETYPQTLDAYLREHRARLERLWRRYGPGGMFAGELVLIDLPGCFVLCERIETTPLWLEGIWAKHGQEEAALERLHDSWLYDTGEKDGR
ncbi:hypothetical protein ACFXDI_50425 [Streptomyces mirabilis]|uniref:hypothetical protein n=1 Tax=Streptomyces mirabilis TaxID=68239 RepID=UPI003676A263